MLEIDNMKFALLLPPQLKDDGDFASNTYVDTRGFNHVRFLMIMGVTDIGVGSTAEGTAPKVEECDTTGGTYTDVTSAALADAIADDEDSLLFAIDVDLRKSHKRYMQVNAPHAGDGTVGANMAIIAILSKAEGNIPATATAMGLAELIKA
ncbi:MAG: hypothetical protein KAT00_06065 [Planctomycetes bacterium]|nr:hypothetical protein [Planctomycetota bacterium]